MKSSDSFVIVKDTQGYRVENFYLFPETRNLEELTEKICYYAAKVWCFNDCSDEDIEAIYIGGREVRYMGWQPSMLFEFYDAETKEVIWSRRFPEWDH